ncbi:MAG: hypothetical protein AB7S70_02345 [Hyphomicrobium sp.]
MTKIQSIARTLAILAVFAAAPIGALNAAESLSMKPNHGISFDVGQERAVSYFHAGNGTCELVLTIAGEPDWDAGPSFTATRFEASVTPQKPVRFGSALEFACQPGATAMSVTHLKEIAAR